MIPKLGVVVCIVFVDGPLPAHHVSTGFAVIEAVENDELTSSR
jgi:hypothetical protein